MTTVTIKNLGQGLRSFHDIEKRSATLRPGDSRTMPMAAHHVMLLEREAQKPNATVQITMAKAEREEYEAELKGIRDANRNARSKTHSVIPARPVPNAPRQPPVDTRFLTDPQTVHPERSADPELRRGHPGEARLPDGGNDLISQFGQHLNKMHVPEGATVLTGPDGATGDEATGDETSTDETKPKRKDKGKKQSRVSLKKK